MTVANGFEATFDVAVDPIAAWVRLTAHPLGGERYWIAGFDAAFEMTNREVDNSMIDGHDLFEGVKCDDPCGGTTITIRFDDRASPHHTGVHVSQTDFGEWFASMRDVLEVGWAHIVADLRTYLVTGVHPGRHLRPWGDLGASASPEDGGVRVADVRPDGLAAALGLEDGDLLVALCNTPVSSLHDLTTILRVAQHLGGGATSGITAEWIRAGVLMAP